MWLVLLFFYPPYKCIFVTYPETQDDGGISTSSKLLLNATATEGHYPKAIQSNAWQSWLSGSRGLLLGLVIGLGLALIGVRISAKKVDSTAIASEETTQVVSAPVTTEITKTTLIRQTISTNGTVEAFDLLSVAPQASGLKIQLVNVREGDYVTAGQVLATLDDAVLRSQIAQAQAQITAAQAQVAQAQAQAAQAEAAVAEAQENFDRYNSLFAQGAISAEELTSRRTQVTTQVQTVGAAYAAIESANATVGSREAEVNKLTTQLAQTQVLAPSSGVIVEKRATVGDTASTSSPLFKIIEDGQLELAVKVPQAQLAQINVGTPVQIRASSDGNLQLQGRVRTIDPTVDAQTRQATVKVGLPNSDLILPGMFLQASIVTGTRKGVVIPAKAVLPQPDGTFMVYSLNANKTVRASVVEVGERIPATDQAPAKIEITNGIDDNVPVVVEGASYLQDGDRVEVIPGENA